MKIIKLLAAAGVVGGYCAGAYIQRGYWNPVSDAFMIAFMASVVAVAVGAFKERQKDRCKVKSFEERYDELRDSIKKSA